MYLLIPIILVLLLSLKTKNIYFSLIIGLIVSVLIFTRFNILNTLNEVINILGSTTYHNMGILIYIAFLGMFIYLIDKSGSVDYFASKLVQRINTKRKTIFLICILGILCFIDDYFSLFVVNTATESLTDKNGISRTKLAYLIDATASPICVLTPISSWVGLITASLPITSTLNGFSLYISTIPFSFYSIFTIIFILVLGYLNFDFGKMRKMEEKININRKVHINTNAQMIDLVLPIFINVVITIFIMLFTGGIFEGATLLEAFMNCDAILSLVWGGFLTLIFMALLYIPRGIISKQVFLDSITEGFQSFSPAILILILAWSFGTVYSSDYLAFTDFVSDLILGNNIPLSLLPCILFITCFLITLCIGSSWTAIVLLVPLVSILFNDVMTPLMVLSTAAILSGGAAGDHLGPITDTTVLSASITKSDYIDHVTTQSFYGLFVVIISAMSYLLSGVTGIPYLGLSLGFTIPLLLKIIQLYVRRKYDNN